MNEIFLDPTPCNEECVQAGSEHYGARARAEAAVYIRQLKRLFPIPVELEGRVKYVMRMNQYDSDVGCYLDIRLIYWDLPAAATYAMQVEDNLPECWDDEAATEMAALKAKWRLEAA